MYIIPNVSHNFKQCNVPRHCVTFQWRHIRVTFNFCLFNIMISVRTIIIKDDWELAYSLDWQYSSVLGKITPSNNPP